MKNFLAAIFVLMLSLTAVAHAEDAETYYNRGEECFSAENYNEAINCFTKAIEVSKDNKDAYNAYIYRGLCYERQEKFDLAIQDYNKTVELDPCALSYSTRGFCYAQQGKFDLAIQDLTKTIELDPNDLYAYYMRGLCYEKLGDTAKAQADFAKAKELGYNG